MAASNILQQLSLANNAGDLHMNTVTAYGISAPCFIKLCLTFPTLNTRAMPAFVSHVRNRQHVPLCYLSIILTQARVFALSPTFLFLLLSSSSKALTSPFLMLTLNTGSVCDVCSEDYGPQCLPHSIPCGHVLCSSCCNTIIEKTSPRLSPVCPFCRELFTSDSVRLIRIDFTSTRWNTPRVKHATLEACDLPTDTWRQEDRILLEPGSLRSREEARRLEDKVAKVAVKKCSVEEVSTLHSELQQWLTSEVKSDDQNSSLALSAALLRAILTNHLAHSEASRMAKSVEMNLKAKLDDVEITNGKLEAEIRRQKVQYAQKVQECQSLRSELNRLKLITTTLGMPPTRSGSESPTHESRHHQSSPLPPSTSPTPSSTYNPSSPSPLSRYGSTHIRSASMASRPTTPAASTRSQTPAIRSHTPSLRSQTPSIRSQTPSIRSHASSTRSETPVPPLPTQHHHHHQQQTQTQSSPPPPPPVPPKPRRLSHPSPPKMTRTVSEEKEQAKVHQRWIPPYDPDVYNPPTHHNHHHHHQQQHHAHGVTRPASAAPGFRTISSAAAQPSLSRYTSSMNAT